MKRTATTLTALALLCAFAMPAWAQDAEPLGDEFIFFVEGVNPEVPEYTATLVEDPSDADNTLLQFAGGNYANPALTWPATTGVDVSTNQANRDSIFFDLRVGPGAYNETDTANVFFMLLDSEEIVTDGDPANDDIAFRLIWRIPPEYFDNEWHEVVLPFPPATVAELEAARGDTTVGGEPLPPEEQLDEIAKRWEYQGGYNADGNVFATPGTELFQEFDFANVFSFGFFWDQGSGPGGNVYVDDFYIGSVNTDLEGATGAGNPYSGTVSVEPVSNEALAVSFTPQEDVGAYRVYLVTEEGADVTNPEESLLLERIVVGSPELGLVYPLSAPHPNVPDPQATFAVTVESAASGIENTNAVYATGQITDAPVDGYAFGMTEAEVDGLFSAFSEGSLDVSFLDLESKQPFVLGAERGSVDGPEIGGPDDIHAEVYLGWAPDPEFPDDTIIMVYADITDDVMFWAQNLDWEPFRWDRLTMYLGTYRVPFPLGSNHAGLATGEDFGINIQPLSADGMSVTEVAPIGYTPDLFGAPIFQEKEDGSGWRVLTAFLMDELAAEEVSFERPEPTEIAYFPTIFALDEQDGPNADFVNRNVIVSSDRPNLNFASPGWFASPAQWEAVAWAGSEVTAVSNEDPAGLDYTFALHAPYPNPAAGRATVAFELDQTGPVTLEVFDVLGRRVAQLQKGEALTAGRHTATLDGAALSAGLYVVRLEAGSRRATQQLVLVK